MSLKSQESKCYVCTDSGYSAMEPRLQLYSYLIRDVFQYSHGPVLTLSRLLWRLQVPVAASRATEKDPRFKDGRACTGVLQVWNVFVSAFGSYGPLWKTGVVHTECPSSMSRATRILLT